MGFCPDRRDLFGLKLQRIACLLGAVGQLTLADWFATGELDLGRLAARLVFVTVASAATWLARRSANGLPGGGVLAVLLAVLYFLTRATIPAWLAVGAFWALLPALEQVLAVRGRLLRLATRATLAGGGALALLVADQVESRFADEEFFTALTGLLLWAALWLLLTAWVSPGERGAPSSPTRRRRILALAATGVGLLVLVVVAVLGYRASFYPSRAPEFADITRQEPFLCSQVAPGPAANDGERVWERLVARVEAQPDKTPPDLAFLALARHDDTWAAAFREALLAEARAGAFTRPAGSVKSVQFEAAWRVYYTARIRQAFPALFSPDETSEIDAWIAQINRRALRPEWVDGLYAFAFGTPVQGPYANQEIGAGLLAALTASDLAPAALQPQNQAFLEQQAAGWAKRFRNTDDAYLYQTVWLVNAYLQSLAVADLQTEETTRNQQLAFDWLLLQARPDGTAPTYNHPIRPELAHVAYLGALLLDDPHYLWLADRALDVLEAEGRPLVAIPGIESPLALQAMSPTAGSCLLYGDSGLPTRTGPLAPDKIIFRDGWTADSTWMLLNLRFSGWHRYKASNQIAGLYQGRPLVVEQGRSQPYAWLPAGRSLPRDKRLTRQDLNGLLVPRRGLGQVLWTLTGQGSRWAQDPPAYARVERFETLGGLDLSRTALDDWRGWDQARTIYFFPGGPVFIVDEAQAGLDGGRAALTWHLAGQGERLADGLQLNGKQGAVRLAWPSDAQPQIDIHSTTLPDGAPGWDVVYYAPHRRRLDLTTAYLGPAWADATLSLDLVPGKQGNGWLLSAEGSHGRQLVLHNPTPGCLEAGGVATDGLALTVRESAGGQIQVCYVGGSELHLALAGLPAEVTGGGVTWRWREGMLVLQPLRPGTSGCVDLRVNG